MKHLLFSLPVLMLLAGMLSCSKQPAPDGDSTLNVNWADVPTKGTATSAEKTVNALWFYVFDGHGMLEIAHQCTSAELAGKKADITVKYGNKTVYAIANLGGTPLTAANGCATLAELEAVSIGLLDNTTSAFIMTAKGTANVSSASGASCSLNLARPVAKVSLGTVTNNLPSPYGAIKIRHAFLCNVVGNQNIAGTASPSTWYNQNGTDKANGGKTATIGQGGHNAQASAFTWKSYGTGQSIAMGGSYNFASGTIFYGMPNSIQTVPSNAAYTASFTPTCTVLMLVAEIKGVLYYYPVSLSQPLRKNTDNLVNIKIIGLGNTLEDGPFNRIGRSDLSVDVRVLDWTNGSTYTETI